MSTPNLNVRVGLLFDEKSLANLERQMRTSGQRLSRIGTDLTLSLSLPLAAFGVAAIKAGGDIESLTLALKSQLGTAEAAAKELDLLTEAAKNPGLGVEQAVRGSVRLQGVGFAAEEARQVLIQMGNAIAATGGSAEELDNVTRQFAQMTSKGRVLQEDVSILSENMPGLAQLMQKAFGTQSVEAIRNMGVSGKEFVTQITKAAEELPRVEGGIKNGIGNAMDSLKQSAAKVGLAINQAFDVTATIEAVSGALLTLAEGFATLDPTIQKVILGFAGMLIAIGPLIKAKGVLMLAGSRLIDVWGGMVGFMKPVITAFNALNLATKAFILVGLVYALVDIADQFGVFQQEATSAEKAQATLNETMKDAEASINAEKGAASQLIGVLQDETSSREAKLAALEDLKKINPTYFGQLREENGEVIGLTAAYDGYVANLLLAAKAKKAEGRLIEIDEKKDEINKQLIADQAELNRLAAEKPVRRGGAGSGDYIDTSGTNAAVLALVERIATGKEILEQLKKEEAQYTTISKAGYEAAAQQKEIAKARAEAAQKEADAARKSAEDGIKNAEKAAAAAKVLKEVLTDIGNAPGIAEAIGEDAGLAKIEALRKGIERLIDAGFKPASEQVQNLKKQLDSLTANPDPVVIDFIGNKGGNPIGPVSSENTGPAALPSADGLAVSFEAALTPAEKMAEIMERLTGDVIDFGTAFDETAKIIEEGGSVAQQAMMAIAGAVQNYADQGGASFKEFGMQALKAGAQVVRSFIMQGVAAAAASALKFLPPPFNLAAAGIAGAAAGVLFNKLLSKIPGFAKGTMDAPGGLALVGEKGPEILNIPKHSQVYTAGQTSKMLNGMGGGGGNVNLNGEFTVRGTDLVLVLERAQQKNNRFR